MSTSELTKPTIDILEIEDTNYLIEKDTEIISLSTKVRIDIRNPKS